MSVEQKGIIKDHTSYGLATKMVYQQVLMAVGEAFVGGKIFQVESNLGSPTPIQTATVNSIMARREAANPDSPRVWAAAAYLGRGCGMLLGQPCWLMIHPNLLH